MSNQPPRLAAVYAERKPNEIEQRLAAQRKPGYVPPGMAPWILAHLPPNDPRARDFRASLVNGQPIELDKIFKQ